MPGPPVLESDTVAAHGSDLFGEIANLDSAVGGKAIAGTVCGHV